MKALKKNFRALQQELDATKKENQSLKDKLAKAKKERSTGENKARLEYFLAFRKNFFNLKKDNHIYQRKFAAAVQAKIDLLCIISVALMFGVIIVWIKNISLYTHFCRVPMRH